MTTPKRVAVIGQGYVGLPVAMASVAAGYDVVGFDLDESKISGLAAGRSHVVDHTDEDIAAALHTQRYLPTLDSGDLTGFDIAVITVPTPLIEGRPDLSFVTGAAEMLGPFVRAGSTVILESTTYPGTTDELLVPILERHTGLEAGKDFHVGYSPERIDPGNKVWTFERTPKVVSGLTPACLAKVQGYYDDLVDTTVAVSHTRVAELTKLLENTYRHVNIALVNELAIHAQALQVNIWETIEAASTKPFGFTPFVPGPGVGGHCLPIDPSYLSWRIERELGVTSRFVTTANDINNQMPDYVVSRVQRALNSRTKAVNGATVLVLGVAYKKNTNDARETPTTGIVQGLLQLGATVLVHDPHVGAHALDPLTTRVELTEEVVRSTDVVVLVTDHDDTDYDLVLRAAPYVFDTRNRLAGPNVETL